MCCLAHNLHPPIFLLMHSSAAKEGCKHTQFIAYTPDFLSAISAVSPTKAKILQEVLPFVPTHRGGVSKDLASFVLSEFEAGEEIAVRKSPLLAEQAGIPAS